ncbi:unnamed protein product [Caenorhabditis nigoni]
MKLVQIPNTVSLKIKNLQKQLFFALVFQAMVPIILMHIPVTILYTCSLLDIIFRLPVESTIALFPALDPFPTIFIVKSYRNTVLDHTHLCTVADEEFRTRRRWDYELIHVINGVNYHAIDSGTFRDISEIPIQNPEPRKRTWDMTDVIWEYSSKCGKWSHEMPTSKERALRQKFHTQKCGIGFLCKEHAEPFDYWYYQNLPRRLVQEPFWCGMFQGDVVEFGLKLLKNYDEQSKREIQNQNPMSSFSWGFKPGEDAHISEKYQKAEIQISGKSNFQNFLKILKFLSFFIFLPILISLISYSLFLAT